MVVEIAEQEAVAADVVAVQAGAAVVDRAGWAVILPLGLVVLASALVAGIGNHTWLASRVTRKSALNVALK